jgi:hypothetical protein
MGWLASIGVAFLTGALALAVAGFVANVCVGWYRISGFEGKAGYFVVAVALLGAIAGFVIGLVSARLALGATPRFAVALGVACGVVLLLGGVALLVCRVLADVPPRRDGHEMMIELDLRLPPGVKPTRKSEGRLPSVALGSLVGGRRRAVRTGEVDLERARQEADRWHVSASVFLFTARGGRLLQVSFDGGPGEAFLVPLPAHPTAEHEAWSDWLPRRDASGAPWPDTKLSYRFRVQPVMPPPPPPDPVLESAGRFASLAPRDPLAIWLEFLASEVGEQRAAVERAVAERQSELAALIGGADDELRSRALRAVPSLGSPSPEVVEAVAGEGAAIAAAIERCNAMPEDDPEFLDVQIGLRGRFTAWKYAWWHVQQRCGLDGRAPVQRIHDLAAIRARGTGMDEIVVAARAILDALRPEAGGR